jgi:hypothetical protein
MRMSGLLGAAIALSVLTPIASANAATISMGGLMYTDLFLWPDWRGILAKYDCTTELNFYLTNKPSAPPPVVITPPPVLASVSAGSSGEVVETPDPTGTPGGDPPGGVAPTSPGDPIGTPGLPGGGAPGPVTAVPEPSTWAMLLLGFAGLGYAGFRRSRNQTIGGANATGGLPASRFARGA